MAISAPITTWATLKTAVADYLNRTDLTNQIELFIHMAQRKLERTHNFAYMENRTTQALTSGDYSWAIPTRYKDMIAMKIIYDSRKYPTIKMTPDEILSFNTQLTTDTGRPTRWAYLPSDSSKFWVRPTADQAYTVDITYYRYSAILSNSNTTNWLVTDAPELILYSSLLEAEPFLHNDKRIEIWGKMAAGALADIINTETQEWLKPNMEMYAI